MQYKSEMQQGWDFATSTMGTDIAVHMGSDYVRDVEAAIKQLEDNINNHPYRNLDVPQLQGYMFEKWSAETFNIDAIASDSKDRATVLHSTAKDSVDIRLKTGEEYSAKSYSTPRKTAIEQARLNTDTRKASYKDQWRLVPSDQVDEARNVAEREAKRNLSNPKPERLDAAEAYSDAASKMTEKIESDGASSKSVTRKEVSVK